MNWSNFYLLIFGISFLSYKNCDATLDSVKAKEYQLIVDYDKTTLPGFPSDSFKILEINENKYRETDVGYYIHEEEAEGGPYNMIWLYGRCNFTDRQRNKICLKFEIYYSN